MADHPAPRLDLVGIVTADLDRSLDFYRLLGLEIPDPGGAPHVEIMLPAGLRLAWDTVEVVRSFDPGWTPPAGGHRVALAFDCGSPAGVDATYTRLVEADHDGHRPPWDAMWGQRYAVVRDPDGGAVDLFAEMAGD
ncbi:MAG: VOC family protein [Microthrixaceae bacterium]